MGGQSFRCPLCSDKWFLTKHALHGHLGAKHKLKNFEVTGTGPNTEVLQHGAKPDERT